MEKHLDHFESLSVKSVWIGDILDRDDHTKTRAHFGDVDDFTSLAKVFKKKGVYLF